MYKFLCIICLLLCFHNGNGQLKSTKPLFELLADLKKAKTDTNRVRMLLQLTNYYLERVPQSEKKIDSAFYFTQLALKMTGLIGSPLWQNETMHCLAKYYFKKGEYRRGKAIITDIVEEVHNRREIKEEIRWLDDLQDHILLNDSLGLTRVDCFKRIALLYDRLNNRKEKINAEFRVSNIYFLQGRYSSADNTIHEIIKVNHPLEDKLLYNAYHLLSEINRYRGELNQALLYALKCVKGIENNKEIENHELFFGELALVYQELGLVSNSIEWYKKALAIRVQNHHEPFAIYRTMGFLIQQLVKQKSLKEVKKLVYDIPKQNPPRSAFDSAILLQVKANYYNMTGDAGLAESYYLKMIQSKVLIEGDPELAFIAYQDIGEFYLQHKEYKKSKPFLLKALKIDPNQSTLSRIRDIHLMLYKLDSSTADYISALRHVWQYQVLNDSLFNLSKSKQIEELRIQYETDKIEQNNNILEKESKMQRGRLAQANLTRNWITVGLVLMFIFLVFLFYHATMKQRTNKKLKIQQNEIHQQNMSLSHLINEKEWLIKEIHHRVKNNFHTIIGLLDTQSGFLTSSEAVLALHDSQHRVQAMSLMHQKLYQSTNLSTVEMSGYIHELVNYLRDSFDTRKHIVFKLNIENMSLNLSHALPLGLILNEAITNSIKYAFANQKEGIISITLNHEEEPDHYLLTIRDNGSGLPEDFNYKKSHSMGLNLMEGLTEDMNGHFTIRNNLGTMITISFVYDPENTNDIIITNTSQKSETAGYER